MASDNASLQASCEGPLGIPLQSVLSPKASCGVEAGSKGFLSSADMNLGVPLESPQGSQASSRLETCTSTFLPTCSSSVRFSNELTQISVAFPRGFPTGLSHVQLWCESILGVTVEAVQENQVPLEWTVTFGGLLEWWHDAWSSSRLFCGESLLLRCDGNTGNPFPKK